MSFPSLAIDDWKPVSRPVAIIELVFLALFLLYAALDRSGFLILDYANLMIHEGGHPLFGILGGGADPGFGYTLMVLGGTLLELIVPLACASYFFFRRESTGAAFCTFWFFENFLFLHDTQIAHVTRTLGWLGMLASVAWFAYCAFRPRPEDFS